VRWAASDFSTGVIPRDAAISVGMLGVPVHIRWCTASRRHNRRCERLILGPQSIAQPFDQPVSFAQLDYLLTRALGLPLQAANPSRRCHRRDGGWNARDVRATGRASRHPARERGTVMRSSMCWPLVRCGKARHALQLFELSLIARPSIQSSSCILQQALCSIFGLQQYESRVLSVLSLKPGARPGLG
jgi:hypothetical protein